MSLIARIVIPNIPHHVTQRGNRRETVFFEDNDYRAYLSLLTDSARKAETEIWAYCLMPNHVHLILVPSHEDGLRATLGDVHRRYTGRINSRNEWTGHLWQGRFGSVAMDEEHLMNAVRYVSMNPVRAKIVERAADWPWSSVGAHLSGKDSELIKAAPVLDRCPDFAAMLESDESEELNKTLRNAETIGRPIAHSGWVDKIERITGRNFRPQKRGPKAKK